MPANETLASYSGASSVEYLDVTGGPAGTYFNTNTFVDAFDTANGGLADETFTQDASTGSTSGGFDVGGSGTLTGNAAVPEPTMAGVCAVAVTLLGCRRRVTVRR